MNRAKREPYEYTSYKKRSRDNKYGFISRIRYVIIEIIIGDSNDNYANMIAYMLLYIFMNQISEYNINNNNESNGYN